MSDYADNLRKSMINATRRLMRMVQEMQEKDEAALREQVIRMAREAGFQTLLPDEHIDGNGGVYVGDDDIAESLERFFHLAAAAGAEAEREACARLCADYTAWGREWGQDSNHMAAEAATNECAAAIRARGERK